MSNLKNRLLKKLKTEDVHPISKLYFVLKNAGIWILAGLFFIFSIFATALVFYFIMNLEIISLIWEAPRMIPKLVFVGVPIFWVLFSLGLVFFTGLFIEKTKGGYRRSTLFVFGGGFLLQLILGVSLSQTTLTEVMEKQLERRVNFFENVNQKKEKIWRVPEEGFLGGKILEISDLENWMLLGFRGEEWQLKLSKKTKMPQNVEFKEGQKVCIRGKLIDREARIFEVQEIFPFRGRQKELRKNMRQFQENQLKNGAGILRRVGRIKRKEALMQ